MPDPREYVVGSSSLALGVDSYTIPTDLGDKQLVFGQNITVRGGIAQTRPGSRSLFCLPDGNFQGATLFTPDNGVAQLVFAVDGKIYVSAAPFTSYRRLFELQFSITAKYIAWAICLKSTDYDINGNIYSLDDPYSVLVMQDGLTRAAYWDGGTAAHLNPATPDAPDQTDIVPGYTETPIGLWMIWSGNRLWVSRGNQIYASDIGNPLKFTESLYLNEARAFYLSGPCTGMIEVPSDSSGAKGFIAFTDKDGTLFQSYIQDRTLWLATPLFQNTILPNIGCVAPRSLVTQYGLNWWFSARGFTNLNAAFRQNLSSRIDYQDNQMFASKAYLGPDLSGICASHYENYLMCSVPSGDVLNRHTWVLDQAPFDGNANAWTGIWTGWKPIEWCRGIVNGSERVFFGSIDYDGKNRIWEAMLPDRTDNGCRITCYAQLRDHAGGNLDQKRYEWTKFFLSQILGEVDLNIYVASTKGGYQLQKNYHLVASEGQIFSDTEYSENGPFMVGNRVQTRTIRTPSDPDDNECNACGVESKEGNMIDYAFTHLLVWSGQMGIRAYQMHMRESPERQAGDCEEDEVAPRTLNAAGCSGLELFVSGQLFDTYTASVDGMTRSANGLDVYIRREATSYISQANAQAMAECALQQIINQLSDVVLEPGAFENGEAEVGSGTYVIVSAAAVGDCPLSIEGQPVAQSVTQGGNAQFSTVVLNSAGGTVTYQWQVSTDSGVTWANLTNVAPYSGVATDTLDITAAPAELNGYLYRCVASVATCEVTTDSAALEVVSTVTADALIVAGGGGGGKFYGGGGGGGQVSTLAAQVLALSTTYPVVVGAGGAGATTVPNYRAANGGDSSFNGTIAKGGGGGGGGGAPDVGQAAGAAGGPGGGGGAVAAGGLAVGGTGTPGGNGGNGNYPGGDSVPAGGGGSTAGNGQSASLVAPYDAGDGANGVQSSISGVATYYGGGGGGGVKIAAADPAATPGTGGLGGGANGTSGNNNADNATPNTGGGGGGGGPNVAFNGGNGGSGVVIVRYPGAQAFTGGVVTTVAGDTVHTFTASGNLAPL